MKTYVGIVRDHSGSMAGLVNKAIDDYNTNVVSLKEAAIENYLDMIVSTVCCGITDIKTRKIYTVENKLSSVTVLRNLDTYKVEGMTPLFDSVGELINIMKSVPDFNDPQVSFLILTITDGGENASSEWRYKLAGEIQKLTATDRWTFAFRVPRGYKHALTLIGIPEYNILEWDQTQKGFETATNITKTAVKNFYRGVAAGVRSSTAFFSDLKDVKPAEVKAVMKEITKDVKMFPVASDTDIKTFTEAKTKKPYKKGTAFYQLVKPEKAVQDYKKIVIKHRKSGKAYEGAAARTLLNLPTIGTIRLNPGENGGYDIFIQSTSLNRKLPAGSKLLVWDKAV